MCDVKCTLCCFGRGGIWFIHPLVVGQTRVLMAPERKLRPSKSHALALRRLCYSIVSSSWFERAVHCVIISSIIILAAQSYTQVLSFETLSSLLLCFCFRPIDFHQLYVLFVLFVLSPPLPPPTPTDHRDWNHSGIVQRLLHFPLPAWNVHSSDGVGMVAVLVIQLESIRFHRAAGQPRVVAVFSVRVGCVAVLWRIQSEDFPSVSDYSAVQTGFLFGLAEEAASHSHVCMHHSFIHISRFLFCHLKKRRGCFFVCLSPLLIVLFFSSFFIAVSSPMCLCVVF